MMQVITGSRREVTVKLWEEQLEKQVKRLNNSMECFRRFHEDSDAEHIMEDAKRLAEIAEGAKNAIYQLDLWGVS